MNQDVKKNVAKSHVTKNAQKNAIISVMIHVQKVVRMLVMIPARKLVTKTVLLKEPVSLEDVLLVLADTEKNKKLVLNIGSREPGSGSFFIP